MATQLSSLNSKMQQPLVSIIVPVYNAGKYLRPCLNSLVNQTLREIEIICVLDCPTDGSDVVVEEFAARDSRIVVVRNECNLHVGCSRNRGIEHASGLYIGFSDHDDTHQLDMYEKMIALTSDLPPMVISSELASYIVSKNNEYIEEQVFLSLLARDARTHVTPIIYLRDFILNNHVAFIDNKTCSVEDTLFNVQCMSYVLNNNLKVKLDTGQYYNHIDTGANQNKSYDHWTLSKVIVAIEKLNDIAVSTQVSQQCAMQSLARVTVRNLYTSFLRESQHASLLKAIQMFRQQLKRSPVCKSIISSFPLLGISSLPLSKRLFSLALRFLV